MPPEPLSQIPHRRRVFPELRIPPRRLPVQEPRDMPLLINEDIMMLQIPMSELHSRSLQRTKLSRALERFLKHILRLEAAEVPRWGEEVVMELIRRLIRAHDVVGHADAADWTTRNRADPRVAPRAFPLAYGGQVSLQLSEDSCFGVNAEGFVDLSYFLARKPRHQYWHRSMRSLWVISIADDFWSWEAGGVADLGREDFFKPRAIRPFQEEAEGKRGDLVVEGEANPATVVI
ncbi:hypothetical protein V501_10269 [Pseudogymnoascus sp. VKM F-4519 (FW-2642)]|nr:hypothetical protein V501_10269 [Pseudogymnoascus sp. VKM F-4519 (FW-2642)]